MTKLTWKGDPCARYVGGYELAADKTLTVDDVTAKKLQAQHPDELVAEAPKPVFGVPKP